jgi:hypothetical protein
VWAAIGVAMLFMLGQRSRLDVSVAKDRNPEFVMLSDGSVRNGFTVKLRNMEDRPRKMELALDGLPGGDLHRRDGSGRGEAVARAGRASGHDAAPARLCRAAPCGGEAGGLRLYGESNRYRGRAGPRRHDIHHSGRKRPVTQHSRNSQHAPRPFTGRHMAMIMIAFFGVVIAVNVLMARFAVSTFGGVVVENSYVASQHFNRWLDEARVEGRWAGRRCFRALRTAA